MSDLIERLLKGSGFDSYGSRYPTKLDIEAADEIERLTAENMELHADAMEFNEKLTKVAILRLDLETENIRLQARVEALEAERDTWDGHKVCELLRSDLAGALAKVEKLEAVVEALVECKKAQKMYESIDYVSGWGDVEQALAALKEESDDDNCQCDACRDGTTHWSDCAVHNAPAYPRGECNCGVLATEQESDDE